MILYFQSNEIENGQIAYGKSAVTKNDEFFWDENDNILKPINGSFYVKVNAELYSKYFVKSSLKSYNYPGYYNLKCYYSNVPWWTASKALIIRDGKTVLK